VEGTFIPGEKNPLAAYQRVSKMIAPGAATMRDPAAAEKGRDFIRGLGGAANVHQVEAVAETRLRVVVEDDTLVDEDALRTSGVEAVMRLPTGTIHLIVGLNADQYAAEMHAQLAGAVRLNGAVAAAAGGR
jgi:PTS system glucose-specific IIC component